VRSQWQFFCCSFEGENLGHSSTGLLSHFEDHSRIWIIKVGMWYEWNCAPPQKNSPYFLYTLLAAKWNKCQRSSATWLRNFEIALFSLGCTSKTASWANAKPALQPKLQNSHECLQKQHKLHCFLPRGRNCSNLLAPSIGQKSKVPNPLIWPQLRCKLSSESLLLCLTRRVIIAFVTTICQTVQWYRHISLKFITNMNSVN
jgi:hypothetical protein